jgi:hypothetical protein
VAVNSIYASIIPSYKYNSVLKSFSYGTQVMGHPVQPTFLETGILFYSTGALKSSANSSFKDDKPLTISLIKIEKKRGPNTDP